MVINARYKMMCLNRLTVSSVRQHYFSKIHCLKFGVVVTPHNLQLILCAITTILTEMMSVRKSVGKCTHSQCMRRVHTFNMCIVSRARLSRRERDWSNSHPHLVSNTPKNFLAC